MARSSSRTTLSMVARTAGVSTATASMVLSGKSEGVRIASATAERVFAAAVELDYSPNLLVRSLQRGSSHVLSLFSAFRNLDDDDLYMDRLSRALEQAAGARGFDLLIHCAFDRTAEETYQVLNGGRADGVLLFAPRQGDPLLDRLRESRLPTVLINTHDPEGKLSSVKEDVMGGVDDMAAALIAAGHHDVVFLHSGPIEMPDAEERFTALQLAYRKRGFDLREASNLYVKGRLESLLHEWQQSPVRPTALFCGTDRLAFEIIPVIERFGWRIPDDISVVGYDGIRWPSDTHHQVTSVAVDLKSLAREAVDLLLSPSGAEARSVPTSFKSGTTLGPAVLLQRSKL